MSKLNITTTEWALVDRKTRKPISFINGEKAFTFATRQDARNEQKFYRSVKNKNYTVVKVQTVYRELGTH